MQAENSFALKEYFQTCVDMHVLLPRLRLDFLCLQENKRLHKDLRAAKDIKLEVDRMQADLIKSTRTLDAAPVHPPQTVPAPQVSPASPPQPSSL